MAKEIKGEIEEVVDVAEGCKKITINLDESFSFVPGQYCMLELPNIPQERRAFSIVNVNNKTITFYIKKNHEFTSELFKCMPKDKIYLFGPYGRFVLPPEEKELILIAGGIGITPLYSMIKEATSREYKKKITLFYSARRTEDMCLLDELKSVQNENIKQYFYRTQEGDPRITSERIQDKVKISNDSLVYLCGPQSMMSSLREDFIKSGINEQNIKLEEF